MTKLQTYLQQACNELGITLVIPFLLMVREGVQINAQALLPQLGSPKGMIIVSRYDDLCGAASELRSLGYGYSVLDDPLLSEDFDVETYVEMFSEWGWGNTNERKPDWMQ